jgi:hypothetical protein
MSDDMNSFFGLSRRKFTDDEIARMATYTAAGVIEYMDKLSAADPEVALAAALARIESLPSSATQRMDEMEVADPDPDSGRIEVGKP